MEPWWNDSDKVAGLLTTWFAILCMALATIGVVWLAKAVL